MVILASQPIILTSAKPSPKMCEGCHGSRLFLFKLFGQPFVTKDSAILEALACREALFLALDLSLSHVIIASDCKGVGG